MNGLASGTAAMAPMPLTTVRRLGVQFLSLMVTSSVLHAFGGGRATHQRRERPLWADRDGGTSSVGWIERWNGSGVARRVAALFPSIACPRDRRKCLKNVRLGCG